MPPAGSFEDEIGKLAQRLAANPTSRIFAPLADAYRRAGRISEAIEVCQQGLRHHPDYLSGLVVLGRSYHDGGDLDAAGATFRRILGADPRNVGALRALGEIGHARGDVVRALESYRQALQLEPDDAELRERVESLKEELDRAEAAEAGFGADADETGFAATVATAASESAFDRDQERAAAAAPVGAPPVEPGGEEIATATLADVYAEQGLLERALGIYRRLLGEDPGNARIREKVELLERTLTEEGVPLETEAAAPPVRFEPGEIQITGEQVITAGSVEAFVAPPEGAEGETAFEMAGELEARSPGSRPAPVPWAFLLEDEVDHDPEEVFAARGGVTPGEALVGAGRSEPAASPGPAAGPRPADTLVVPEDDLKKFQEWLKSLR